MAGENPSDRQYPGVKSLASSCIFSPLSPPSTDETVPFPASPIVIPAKSRRRNSLKRPSSSFRRKPESSFTLQTPKARPRLSSGCRMRMFSLTTPIVIPAKAGIQLHVADAQSPTPTFVGVTKARRSVQVRVLSGEILSASSRMRGRAHPTAARAPRARRASCRAARRSPIAC